MIKPSNIKGKTFDRWTVLKRSKLAQRKDRWLCLCKCGTKRCVIGWNLRNGRSTGCRECIVHPGPTPTHGMSGSLRYVLYTHARRRAKKANLPFTIKCTDIPEIPKICPLLGIPLFQGKKILCANSPTLDQITCGRGYVPGNFWVISFKANAMKSNASLKELQMLVRNLKIKLDINQKSAKILDTTGEEPNGGSAGSGS